MKEKRIRKFQYVMPMNESNNKFAGFLHSKIVYVDYDVEEIRIKRKKKYSFKMPYSTIIKVRKELTKDLNRKMKYWTNKGYKPSMDKPLDLSAAITEYV